jgi:hypothetical protein
MSGQRKLEPKGIRPFEAAAYPGYLLREIEELGEIARRAGFGSLDYLLECAAIEARWLVHQREPSRAEPRS